MAAATGLDARIEQIPPQALQSIRRGFSVFGNLPADAQRDFVDQLLDIFGKGSSTLSLKALGEQYSVSPSDAGDVLNAASAVIGTLVDADFTVEEFVQAASGKVFDPKDHGAVRVVARMIVSNQKPIKRSLDIAHLAAKNLPSLDNYDLTVDIRPSFRRNVVTGGVPIALLHLGTDTASEIWVQLRRDEVLQLIESLQRAEKQMQSAEDVISSFLKSP